MPVTPTERSMRLYRKRGFTVIKVEHRLPFTHTTKDLCGGDILALKDGEPHTLIQATTASHRNARIEKLNGLPEAHLWVRTGGRLVVNGWKPLTKSRRKYEVEEIEWEGACK